jgi:adenine-specific DNA methylase
MAKWNYGDAFKRHPINQDETVIFDNGSMVKVHNIFDPLPNIMLNADVIFVDPPWNLGNLNTFYTKAERTDKQTSFEKFYKRLFECIDEISPKTCYIEIGKEYLAEFILEMKSRYKYVTFYNSTYYHKKDRFCYVIRGSNKRKKLPLDNMDEEDIIKWVCENEDYNCIGDLCMGTGLVGLYAYRNGKRFVGTELNHKRLSLLLESIVKCGGSYTKLKKDDCYV